MEYDENALETSSADGSASGSDAILETLSNDSYLTVLSADEVALLNSYDDYDGTISSSVLSYFQGVVAKIGAKDYVLFRDDKYVYRFCYGDLEYQSGTISGAVDIITYNTSDSYGNTYGISYSSDSAFSLTPSGPAVYSNLGMFPELMSSVSYYHFYGLLFMLAVAFLVAFVMPFFGYGLRKRGVPHAKNY